jgi:DNA-binding SARP family transcriptional activator
MAYQPELDKLQRQYGDDPARYFAQLAEAYRRGGRLDEALAMLREHLTGRPNYVSGLVVLGRCLLDQHNDAEARETFERVIVVDGEHIIALKALGEIGERMGDAASARQWYQRLLEIDPMNDEAEAALGRIPLVAAAPPVPLPAAEAPAAEPPAVTPAPVAATPPPAPPVRYEAPPPDAPAPEPAVPLKPEAPVAEEEGETWSAPEAPDQRFEVERPGEREVTPDEVPWTPAAQDAADGRAVEFEDVQGPVLDQTARGAGDDDLAGWVEHPEELLNFDETVQEPKGDEGFAVEPFDESLGWGAGERVSRQITSDDMQEAERAHAEDLAAPVQGLPGLEDEPVPEDPDAVLADGGPVDGLQRIEPDPTAEPLAGLETEGAMMMPPEAPPRSPAVAPGTTGEDDGGRASLAGLPVFFPPDEETREPLRVEPEPEPVVTETMAELYVRQGLVSEARETYRQLLAARPHDRRLAARLAELQEAGPARDARAVYAAAASGGQTSRDFLAEVLGGRASTAFASAAAPLVEAVEVEAAEVEAPLGSEPEPMDRAFGDEPEPRGEPTQPAKDEISLAAIFGEQTAPSPAPAAPPPADAGNRAMGGFSFDEFFSATAPGAPEAAPHRPPRDTLADDEGEEAFRDWLKGLKS